MEHGGRILHITIKGADKRYHFSQGKRERIREGNILLAQGLILLSCEKRPES